MQDFKENKERKVHWDTDLCSPSPCWPAVHWWLINVIISAINSPTPLHPNVHCRAQAIKGPIDTDHRNFSQSGSGPGLQKSNFCPPCLVMEFVISINLELLLLLDWFSESKYGAGTHWKGLRGDLFLITVYKMVYRGPKKISPSCWNS